MSDSAVRIVMSVMESPANVDQRVSAVEKVAGGVGYAQPGADWFGGNTRRHMPAQHSITRRTEGAIGSFKTSYPCVTSRTRLTEACDNGINGLG